MARGRMLSKDISLDEKVAALSDDTARLLFTWLIPHLDVEGRMYGDARLFLSIVAPRRNISLRKVEKYLTELENFGLILRYTLNGNTYLLAPNFEKHQTGLRKEKEAQSRIPPIPPDLLRTKDGVTPDKLFYKRRSRSIEEKYKEKNMDIKKLWDSVLALLKQQVNQRNYNAWFLNTEGLEIHGDTLLVGVKNEEILNYLSLHQKSLIEKCLCSLRTDLHSVDFVVTSSDT